jgi:hypothetical protein
MLAQRSLLLMIFFLFFFEPVLAKWSTTAASGWYRPYLVWLLFIVIVFFTQRWGRKRGA